MESNQSRRSWMAGVLMRGGLLLSYGTLAVQGLMFLLPERLQAKRRRLFAGRVEHYPIGGVRKLYDLKGNEILVKLNLIEMLGQGQGTQASQLSGWLDRA